MGLVGGALGEICGRMGGVCTEAPSPVVGFAAQRFMAAVRAGVLVAQVQAVLGVPFGADVSVAVVCAPRCPWSALEWLVRLMR